LVGPVDGQAGDEDHADGVGRHAADEAGRRVGASDRPHREADVPDDAYAPHHDERASRVHRLGGERMATQPVVELVDARSEACDVVLGSQALEARLTGAQARRSGSLASSATSSGTTVAGSSNAA